MSPFRIACVEKDGQCGAVAGGDGRQREYVEMGIPKVGDNKHMHMPGSSGTMAVSIFRA